MSRNQRSGLSFVVRQLPRFAHAARQKSTARERSEIRASILLGITVTASFYFIVAQLTSKSNDSANQNESK